MERNIMKYIHVNQGNIKGNLKTRRTGRDQELQPVITIKEGKSNVYCNAVAILGPSKVIYGHDKTLLPCGARVVIETDAEVEIIE
tara:strand:- start:197 stop:451 length:255 start_codon:yes stop_codon:yes gene_type:complete